VALDILYFAWVRERVGVAEERLDLPAEVSTPLALAYWLAARGGGYAEAFADPARLRCAVDQDIVPLTADLATAAEIAFFPPVTGG
jgi:molybdopterin synthase sulfur carrier subunit